jgi:chromosome transmission fidelity protein 1
VLQYCQKYKKRLKAKNLMYIKQLLSTLKRWLQIITGTAMFTAIEVTHANEATCVAGQADKQESLQPVNEFLFSTETAHVNFFKLLVRQLPYNDAAPDYMSLDTALL